MLRVLLEWRGRLGVVAQGHNVELFGELVEFFREAGEVQELRRAGEERALETAFFAGLADRKGAVPADEDLGRGGGVIDAALNLRRDREGVDHEVNGGWLRPGG